jgi:hypothetical protein
MLPERDERIKTHLYLQTKYRELQKQCTKLRQHYILAVQEHYATLRHLYLLVECAWCQQRIAWKRKDPAVPGETSHSICVPCAARILTRLETIAR